MRAVVFKHTEEMDRFEVNDRFDFEDTFLRRMLPPRPSRTYRDHAPSPGGVGVFLPPGSQVFKARPYLEFEKHIQNQTHFHIMQEGQATGFTVVLG